MCPSCILLTHPKQARRLEVCAKIVGMPTKKMLFWCKKIEEMLRGVQVLEISLYKSLCLVWNLNLIPCGDMTVSKNLFETYVLHDGFYRKTKSQENWCLHRIFFYCVQVEGDLNKDAWVDFGSIRSVLGVSEKENGLNSPHCIVHHALWDWRWSECWLSLLVMKRSLWRWSGLQHWCSQLENI